MEKYRNFSLFIILIPTPDFPNFYYMLGGNLESLLYGVVSVMSNSRSRIQEIANNSEIKNSRNKGLAQISESTVISCSVAMSIKKFL